MKGIHRVVIQNKRIRYDFELRRNLTVLRGDSATGKTTLIEMIQEFINNGEDSSIELRCDKSCYVLEGATWRGQLSEMKDSIVFIDEGNAFVYSDEFSETIRNTDNYYVIVSREGLPNLPYSVTEIYGIRMSGRYGGLKQHYNEFYRIYGTAAPEEEIRPKTVVTEDSNSGYQFFQGICGDNDITCVPASGKSKMLQTVRSIEADAKILLIADGAAFGSEMDRIMKFLKGHPNVSLYAPESFEWLILSANPLKDTYIREILENPSEYIESEMYFSWERFFTKVLIDKTQGTYLQYSKNHLNEAYLKGNVRGAILEIIEKVHLEE
jgi:hypothetical protein